MKNNWFATLFHKVTISSSNIDLLTNMLTFFTVILTATVTTLLVRRTLLRFLINWIQNNRYRWDYPLTANQMLVKISNLLPK